jgi:hypothetical protein
MKTLALFSILFLAGLFVNGQTKVVKDSAGNFVPVKVERAKKPEKLTGSYFMLNDSVKLPVCVTDSGKLYVNRISKKTGNSYRQYLKVN